jgi:hypothetical protein
LGRGDVVGAWAGFPGEANLRCDPAKVWLIRK